jgi:hypothetical protein
MTEVAVRLAEPDKMAEHSVASLGQTVRRQVAAMNDAISRALGRAGELEALVHNEVAALERSYSENEHRIRNLINELASEREALANNSERVSEALRGIGSQVTREIAAASEKASQSLTQASASMADTLASRGHKITSAVTAAGVAIDEKLAERGARITEQLVKHGAQTAEVLRQSTLEVTKTIQETSDRTTAAISAKSNKLVASVISMSENVGREIPALLERLGGQQSKLSAIIESATKNLSALEGALTEKTNSIGETLADRTRMLQTVMSDHTRNIDASLGDRINALEAILSKRAQSFDTALVERTKALEGSIVARTKALETAVTHHAGGIRDVLEQHAANMEKNLGRQAAHIERSVTTSAQTVQRAVDELAQRSGATAEALSNQAQVLKDVSGGLLSQIHALTKRFEDQGATIMNAARALEVSNTKVDGMMEARQAALTKLLESINGRALELDRMMNSYSHMLEQSLSQAEVRARKVTESLAKDSAEKSQHAIREIERLRAETQTHTTKAVSDLQSGFSSLSEQVSQQLSTLSSKLGETTRQVKASTHKAVAEIEMTQSELRRQASVLPDATRQSASAVRKVLNEQLSAIGNLSEIAGRHGVTGQISKSEPRAAVEPPSASGFSPPALPSPRAPSEPRDGYGQPFGDFSRPGGSYPGPGQDFASGPSWAGANEAFSGLGGVSRYDVADVSQPSTGQEFRQSYGGDQPMEQKPAQWSLGDLLARASEPDDLYHAAQPTYPVSSLLGQGDPRGGRHAEAGWGQPKAQAPVDLGMEEMATAIEAARALDVWQRYNRGDRAVINRNIYNPQGQVTFDKVRRRYETDATFRHIADRYISDFENVLKDSARMDPKGHAIQENLASDTGRIYLLLAHVSGRLG